MNDMGGVRFWKNWGLISRLMLAVGIAIIAGGGVQTYLLMAEGAAEHSARLKRELNETLYQFERPFISDASKFEQAFGPLVPTPHRDAVRRTVDWFRSR